MKISRKHMMGNLNKELNRIRAQMNREVREKCYEMMARKGKHQD